MSPRHRSLSGGAIRMRPVNALSLDNAYLELALMLEEIQAPAPDPQRKLLHSMRARIFVAGSFRPALSARRERRHGELLRANAPPSHGDV
jgi:hypothetical protein